MMTSNALLRSAAALALVAGFGVATTAPAVAQVAPGAPGASSPIEQGVTPGDQSGGLAPQTLPDDDTTLLPGGGTEGTEGQAGIDAAPDALAQPGTGVQPTPGTGAETAPGTMAEPSVTPAQPVPGTMAEPGAAPTEPAAPTAGQQIVVLPDGTRVSADEGQFVQLEDGSAAWEYQGQQYPIVQGGGMGGPEAGGTLADEAAGELPAEN